MASSTFVGLGWSDGAASHTLDAGTDVKQFSRRNCAAAPASTGTSQGGNCVLTRPHTLARRRTSRHREATFGGKTPRNWVVPSKRAALRTTRSARPMGMVVYVSRCLSSSPLTLVPAVMYLHAHQCQLHGCANACGNACTLHWSPFDVGADQVTEAVHGTLGLFRQLTWAKTGGWEVYAANPTQIQTQRRTPPFSIQCCPAATSYPRTRSLQTPTIGDTKATAGSEM